MSVASMEPAIEQVALNWRERVAVCPLGGGPLIPANVVQGPDGEGDYRVSFQDPKGWLRGLQWFRPNGDPVGSTGHRVVQARPRLTATLEIGRDLGGSPAETAPYACSVLAGRFVEDDGEWHFAVVNTPLVKPFTHWWPLPDLAATLFAKPPSYDAFHFATSVRDPFPQPHIEATRLALTATPETFPKDSYALAQWLDKALFTDVPADGDADDGDDIDALTGSADDQGLFAQPDMDRPMRPCGIGCNNPGCCEVRCLHPIPSTTSTEGRG